MSKKLLAILAAIVACISVFAFAGCQSENGDSGNKEPGGDKTAPSGNVILDVEKVGFTASAEYMTLKTTTTVKDYMDALKENGELVFTESNGMITSFYNTAGKVISSTANSYEGYDWAFYIDFTTLEGDDAVYATDYKTLEYGGKTLYSASYGAAGIPCIDGHTYVFAYEYSNFSW